MIQRLQTLWLLLAAGCAFASLKLSYYSGTNARGLSPYELNGTENFLLLTTTVIIGALAIFNIFLFKKRTLQLRLCVLGIVLDALLIFLYYREMQTFSEGTLSLSSILQMIVVLAFVLAARGINKDAKLLKESDRLR
jgi:hypothetical protein